MIRSGQLLRAGSCRSCRTPGSGTRVTHHNESVAGEVTGTADRTSTIGTMPMPVIVALDFPCRAEAMELVHSLGEESSSYKVGLQLLTEEGPGIVRDLVALGKSVFLDLKLHEIPNSVAGAVRAAGKLGVSMVTVHASAGSGVLRAAVAAAAPFPELKVLALTVITSLTDHDLPEIGLAPSVGQQVERLAMLAASCGCHGVVASAHEAASLASKLPHGMLIVTPGVQLEGPVSNDQARVTTPEVARKSGATHIIVGRSITQAANPQRAFKQALAGMRAANGAERTGGCLCGKVRYRLAGEPVIARICWCRDCQHISSNGTVNAIFPTSAMELAGSPAEYTRTADSGNQVRRRFCPSCGCHLFADSTGRPGLTVVRVGTMDNPSSVKPSANIWSASAPAWACLDAALERIEHQPAPLRPAQNAT
jgi:orotidine-5'-phosphate decarboxylase